MTVLELHYVAILEEWTSPARIECQEPVRHEIPLSLTTIRALLQRMFLSVRLFVHTISLPYLVPSSVPRFLPLQYLVVHYGAHATRSTPGFPLFRPDGRHVEAGFYRELETNFGKCGAITSGSETIWTRLQ
jgi:hypothetical protein